MVMEEHTLEDQLLFYAKGGSFSHVQSLLQSRVDQSSSLNVNCRCKSMEDASIALVSQHGECSCCFLPL